MVLYLTLTDLQLVINVIVACPPPHHTPITTATNGSETLGLNLFNFRNLDWYNSHPVNEVRVNLDRYM